MFAFMQSTLLPLQNESLFAASSSGFYPEYTPASKEKETDLQVQFL
jgi:hypothetical protein